MPLAPGSIITYGLLQAYRIQVHTVQQVLLHNIELTGLLVVCCRACANAC